MPNFIYLLQADDPINPKPANTGNDVLNGVVNLGLPLVFFLFIGFTSAHYIRLIQKGRLDLKETITWIIWNLILMIISAYLMLIYIFEFAGFHVPNFLNTISEYLGIEKNVQQWIILIILFFIGFLYAKTFNHAVRISKIKQQIDVLARELAILKGRYESTIDLGSKTSISLLDTDEVDAKQTNTINSLSNTNEQNNSQHK